MKILNRKGWPPRSKREFCQQMAFQLHLQYQLFLVLRQMAFRLELSFLSLQSAGFPIRFWTWQASPKILWAISLKLTMCTYKFHIWFLVELHICFLPEVLYFYILHLGWWSKLIFAWDINYGLRLIFFDMDIQFFKLHFLKRLFSILSLCISSKWNLTTFNFLCLVYIT